MKNTSSIISSLKSKGHKNTKVREALIETLLKAKSPLDITEILEIFHDKGLKPNKTTIYREIIFLKEQSILEEVEFGEGKKRYEISDEHHHHIICVNCKKVKDIPMEKDLNKEEKRIIEKMGYKPIGHSLEFFGLCKNCQ